MNKDVAINEQAGLNGCQVTTSRLAIASAIITIESWLLAFSLPEMFIKETYLLLLAGPLTGVIALAHMSNSRKRLTGHWMAILSILSYLIPLAYGLFFLIGMMVLEHSDW